MIPEATCNLAEEEIFLFPASFAQQRLWFLEQFAPGNCLYNVPLMFRLTGHLDRSALHQSFEAIVQRHEILRTSFQLWEGQLTQVVASGAIVPLPIVDLTGVPATRQEAAAQRVLQQEMQRPFPLSQGPLLRLQLLQLNPTEHILQINLHHIVFDDWSSSVLIGELSQLYRQYSQGESSSLPELPIQYADFAHWQRQWLQQEVLEAQLAYWRQQLQALPTLPLPSDYPRPPVQAYQGATQQLELPQSLLAALEDLSQQAGATLFMTLLAAFQALLYRYTGQEDIVVGSPIANRHRSELEGLIGFFVNSLVLRTRLSGDLSFRELLDRVREVALGAYAHQDLPFEKLVEALHPERDIRLHPLFQVVFALQNAPMGQLELPGLVLSPMQWETRTTRFDLELYLWQGGDNFRSLWGQGWTHDQGLRGVMVYNTDLFAPATIARLCQHFQTLLAAITANPAVRLADLPLLTEAEQQQQLVDWNHTSTAPPPSTSIHQVFEAQVRQRPDAIAVRFGEQHFTYQSLNQGSNQLAHYLQRLGVGQETLVGICLERSAEAIAAMLAVLKAGGAYIPLDPSYPPERLRQIQVDAELAVVLTQTQWAKQFRCDNTQVICLEQEWAAIAQEPEANLDLPAAPDQLAYVIYTSGSTGRPKGVAVLHRGVLRLVCKADYVTLGSDDRVAQVANFAFDAATFEIWGALLNGAELVGLPRSLTLAPEAFAAQLQQQQISVLFLTTALLNQVVREVPNAFQCLRYLLFGGEAADAAVVRSLIEQGAPEQLLHVYGPTENTTFSTWYPVQTVSAAATTIPIGRAIAHTQVYLLDAHLNPVPIGVSGEIYLGGEGLARGYLNQPQLTQERFVSVTLPIANQPIRLYKTGDLARYQPDGNLEFLGRCDDQVKLRGFRIELGEIETVLTQHPAIEAAVVTVREWQGDRSLVAYLVTTQAPPVSELRAFLKAKLPEYMLPVAFMPLHRLPLTPNGKVDRRALPQITVALETPRVAIAPRTSVEGVLAELWKTLLGLEQVGVQDNFFELGGHSLLATQLISRIRTTLGIELPLRSLFETPTIAGLAQALATLSRPPHPDFLAEPSRHHSRSEAPSSPREEVEL